MSANSHRQPAIGAVYQGTSVITPKFGVIACASSGDNAIVAAVAGKRILVLQYNYMANGTVNAKWRSATTDISGLAYLIANTGKVVPYSPTGWVKTATGEALNLNLSAAQAVGGELVYAEVD